MRLQPFFSCALNTEISSLGIFALVALLACLLAIEVACICILIVKMRHAKNTDDGADEQTYFDHGGIVFALGAIPTVAYASLLWLSVACVLAAAVLVILLLVANAKGYRFALSGRVQEQESSEEIPAEADEITSEDAELPADEPADTEEPIEEELYAEELDGDAADEAMFHELFASSEEELLEETDADADEPLQDAEEPMPVPVQEVLPEDGAAAPEEAQPYRVVEKVVTETYKEVIKEVPAEQPSAAADALLEKLSDFLDYEMQKKKDADTATATEGSESLPAMADVDQDEDDEENDDAEDTASGEEADEDDDILDEEDGDGERFTGNERIIGFDEATGCYIVAHYRKSFEAKLIQAKPHIKQYYSELRNALLSYKGSKNRISWSADSFHNGRQPIAKINVKTRILEIYLALDPASLEGTVYRGKDVSSKKKYADTPFQYKVRTPRKFKWAMELVQRTCEEHGLSPIDIEKVDYEAEYAFDTTENLVARGLIKEYIRQEKPATSFELDPDHTPDVPEEDGSVIPANANFLWEFDNERMEESAEEEPVAEDGTAEDAAVACASPNAEETAEEAAEETDAPTVRETVKVTEMRYTERYYTNAEPTFEQVITTTEPIELSDASEDAEDEVLESDEPDTDESLSEPEQAEDAEDEEFFFSDEDPDSEEALSDVEAVFGEEEADGEEDEEIPEEIPEEISEEELDTEEIEYEEIEEKEEPVTEAPVSNTSVALVDLCSVQAYYTEGETVSLQTLKDKGLILPSATTLKVYASASLSKRLNVEANHFTMDAIIAISSVDGESAMIR
ncbi:MAG: uL15 family ribosomal protein [Clostridia bacterium]|nr:uL15 family ribosomal protein [Clostridia bacterium]